MASDNMDRDFAIRTMLGEAGNQGDAGLAAVANVILNRAQDGSYGGKTPTDVVLAKKQFEPWQTRPHELLAIPTDSPKYQRAGQIYDLVSSGEIPDITSGSTHFLNKRTVMDRSGRLPDWAKGEGLDIGAHTFLKPKGAITRQPAASDLSGFDALDALAEPKAATPAPTVAPNAPKVRVTLPNADQTPAPAQPTAVPASDGFDALEKIASASDAPEARQPGGALNAAARGAVEGIPFVGPTLLKGIQTGDAYIRSLENGSTPAQEMKAGEAYGAATDAAHPIAKTAGTVAGNVGSMLPLAALPGGAVALGLRGPMAARMALGGASSAAIGAGDAAVRGEEPRAAAAIGAGVGVLAPVAGRAIGAAVAPVTNRLMAATQNAFSGTARANNALLGAMESAGQDTAAIRAELARNPNLSLADLNTGFREQLVGLGQAGREAPPVLKFVDERRAAAGDQVRQGYADSIGAAPDPVALKDQLTRTAKANADKAFTPILKSAQPVNLDGLSQSAADRIAQARERALAPFTEDARNAMNDAQQLHLTQQQLRRDAKTLGSSSVGSERLASNDIGNVRQQLIDRIDNATGGKFRPAQRLFANDTAVSEAFDDGMSALNRVRNGAKGLEDRPEALKQDWLKMRPAEREAYREGMRTQVATIIENARNPARAGEAVTDPGFNRQKLAIVFGDEEAGKLMRAVEDSRKMAETNNAIIGGTTTAQRTAARESVRVRGDSAPAAGLDIPVVAAAAGGPAAGVAATAVKGANKLAGVLGRRSDLARNRLLAQDLVAAGPAAEAVANRLERFLAARAAGPVAARRAIEGNAPLNLLIRSGGQRAYSP